MGKGESNKIEIEDSNIYLQLSSQAIAAGTNLTEICKTLRISRATLQGWKTKEPSSLTTIRRIKAEIDKK